MPGPTVRSTPRGLVTTRKRGRVLGSGGAPAISTRAPISSAPAHGNRARKVASALSRVRKAYQTGGVTGPNIDKGESKFYSTLAKKTGLSARVLAAQGTQEGGADDDYNILNIGHTDSGDLGITKDPAFSSPKSAAKKTAKFFKGKEGGASQGIRNILSSAGKSDAEQVKAIAGSGWATDPNYFAGISRALPSIKSKPGKKPRPKDVKTLAKAHVSAAPASKPAAKKVQGQVPSVVKIGHIAQKKFGLHVGENPAFGGVEPVHVSDSYHYQRDAKGRGEAIDVSGDSAKMAAFNRYAAKTWGPGLSEMFYDPGISIKDGQATGSIGNHEDHVHVAVAKPGSHFAGSIGGGMTSTGMSGAGTGGSTSSNASSAPKSASKGGTAEEKRKAALRRARAAYGTSSTSTNTSSGISAISRRHGNPVV